jgi:hypothetical protein
MVNPNIGRVNTAKPIDSAIHNIREWLGKIGCTDILTQYDPRINVAVVEFKYQGKPYEYRSTRQENCRQNMHAIARAMEWRVRLSLMKIEDFGTAMTPYQQLPSSTDERISEPSKAAVTAYATLGISPLASNEELQLCYKRMVKAYHPDMAGSAEAKVVFEAKFKEINTAWKQIKEERGML